MSGPPLDASRTDVAVGRVPVSEDRPEASLVDDLLGFVDAGPSPYHAVAECARRLEAAGFRRLDERRRWSLAAGDRVYVVRDGGSLAAVHVGRAAPSEAGFRAVGAHTDSPTLRVRPRADVRRHGYRLLSVEPYGGVLSHTWLDRDLTLAGRVVVRGRDARPVTHLVHLPGAPLRVPSLAIHLHREGTDQGLKLDPQRHLAPLWAVAGEDDPGLADVVAGELGVEPGDVLATELVTADTQPAARGGAGDAFVFAPRLDNLASCHAGLTALSGAQGADATQVLVLNDHEEVGSRSAEGAAGPFLEDLLRRVVAATEAPGPEELAMSLSGSQLVSADTAHAVHPNWADRHDPDHRPLPGGGPVLKTNASQSYATDAGSAAWFVARCADVGVAVQHFVSRADMPCGSTIGPLTAARLGVATVDVGAPVLSMHSCREQAAAADVAPMVAALRAHLESG